jgi:hypothetical protein
VASGRTLGESVLIITDPDGWPIREDWSLPAVAGHEYVHTWQYTLAGLEAFRNAAVWTIEGMAQWISLKALVENGQMPSDALTCIVVRSDVPLRPRLERLETIEGWRSYLMNYEVSLEAVDALVLMTDEQALESYLKNLSRDDWRTAFESAFGLSVTSFYALFDPAEKRPAALLKTMPTGGSMDAVTARAKASQGALGPVRPVPPTGRDPCQPSH